MMKQKRSSYTHKLPFFSWYVLLSVRTRTLGPRGSAACPVSQPCRVAVPCSLPLACGAWDLEGQHRGQRQQVGGGRGAHRHVTARGVPRRARARDPGPRHRAPALSPRPAACGPPRRARRVSAAARPLRALRLFPRRLRGCPFAPDSQVLGRRRPQSGTGPRGGRRGGGANVASAPPLAGATSLGPPALRAGPTLPGQCWRKKATR